MKPRKFEFPNKEWADRNEETATFCSPSTDTDQAVIFKEEVQNGSMSASITAIEGHWVKSRRPIVVDRCGLVCGKAESPDDTTAVLDEQRVAGLPKRNCYLAPLLNAGATVTVGELMLRPAHAQAA
jgi:hypothetical protein